MEISNVHAVQLVFLLLLLFVAAFGLLARKLDVPYPIMLVMAGGLLGLIPGIPRISLNPDLIFFVVLPPLLYAAAWTTSWRDFTYNFVSIFLLAVGLVAFSVIGIALGAPVLLPGFDWRLGLVLGAVVAPTDAIAATSIAQRIRLPKRINDILEGESLVNDATGLLALEFGIAIVVRGEAPTVATGIFRLLYLILGGMAVGVAIGWMVNWIEQRVDDGPIEIALSILVPYAAYLGADRIRASGVLAVVVCGLYLSRRSSSFFTPAVRLQVWAVWEALTFILNGLVFVLIGLQLPNVMLAIHGYSIRQLILYGTLFSGMVIALRFIWVFPGSWAAWWIRTRMLHQKLTPPTKGGITLLGWAGMRGVISLAAAIALPVTMADGGDLAQRSMIIYLAFCVILATLILQGLSLPWIVRVLGVADPEGVNLEEAEARREILEAALARLAQLREKSEDRFSLVYADLEGHYRQRLTAATGLDDKENNESNEHHRKLGKLQRELLHVERQTAIRLRNEGKISDAVLRQLEHELDLREAGPTHVT